MITKHTISYSKSKCNNNLIGLQRQYIKKEKRNVELLLELDGDENILSVSEKKESKQISKSKSNTKLKQPKQPKQPKS